MNRIDKLLAAMTFEEKIGQLIMAAAGHAVTGPVLASEMIEGIRAGRIGSLLNIWGGREVHAVQKIAAEETRLGIPLLIGFDVVHGHETIFPIPLAEAAFDPTLWERSAREAAIEAAAGGINMTFAPMLDIARDPRWGRIAEGAWRRPVRWGDLRKPRCADFKDLAGPKLPARAAATAKHFCAYGAALAGCDYTSADVSERVARSLFASLRGGRGGRLCCDHAGFQRFGRHPYDRPWFHCSAAGLRRDIGFDGVIVSDYNAIAELLRHGVAGDLAEAAAAALWPASIST